MGMAIVPPWDRKSFTATFAVTPANPEDALTCMFCWGPRCEWQTTFGTGGRRVWVGLHESCIARMENGAGSTAPTTGGREK
jgi:hypothetical protein